MAHPATGAETHRRVRGSGHGVSDLPLVDPLGFLPLGQRFSIQPNGAQLHASVDFLAGDLCLDGRSEAERNCDELTDVALAGVDAVEPGLVGQCQDVLAGSDPPGVRLSERTRDRLAQLRNERPWATPDATTLVVDPRGRARWWTFAGWKANLHLARLVDNLRTSVVGLDDFSIAVDSTVSADDLLGALRGAVPADVTIAPWIADEALEGLKFAECLPRQTALAVIERRLSDPEGVASTLAQAVIGWREAGDPSLPPEVGEAD